MYTHSRKERVCKKKYRCLIKFIHLRIWLIKQKLNRTWSTQAKVFETQLRLILHFYCLYPLKINKSANSLLCSWRRRHMLRCSSSWVKGCCSTAIEERFNRIRDENLRRAEPLLRALMFPDNVWAKLWAIFITLDESGDDLISFSEFCEFFSLE